MIMSGRFLDEPKLLALGYDLEQELGKREVPKFLGRCLDRSRMPASARRCRRVRLPQIGRLVGDVDVAGVSSAPLKSGRLEHPDVPSGAARQEPRRFRKRRRPRRGATGPLLSLDHETSSAKSRVTLVVDSAATRVACRRLPSSKNPDFVLASVSTDRRPISELVERFTLRLSSCRTPGGSRRRRARPPCRQTRSLAQLS